MVGAMRLSFVLFTRMISSKITSLVLIGLLAMVCPVAGRAQEEEPSLGDLARNLRKEKAQRQAEQQVPDGPQVVLAVPRGTVLIDNDNLSQVMEDKAKLKPVAQDKTVLSLDATGNRLNVSSPDVMCSMSFNAHASSLIVKPVLVEDLPLEELVKVDGPGSIREDNLQLEVFNGTDWELREITIALTLERRPGEDAELAARARVVPAAASGATATLERHSDVTLMFHLKTETKPFGRSSLREYVGVTPGADEDWRWSIVEAKGIRPAGVRVAPESLSTPLYGSQR